MPLATKTVRRAVCPNWARTDSVGGEVSDGFPYPDTSSGYIPKSGTLPDLVNILCSH